MDTELSRRRDNYVSNLVSLIKNNTYPELNNLEMPFHIFFGEVLLGSYRTIQDAINAKNEKYSNLSVYLIEIEVNNHDEKMIKVYPPL